MIFPVTGECVKPGYTTRPDTSNLSQNSLYDNHILSFQYFSERFYFYFAGFYDFRLAGGSFRTCVNNSAFSEIHYNMADARGKFFIIVPARSMKKNKVTGLESFYAFRYPSFFRLFNSRAWQLIADLFKKILNKT